MLSPRKGQAGTLRTVMRMRVNDKMDKLPRRLGDNSPLPLAIITTLKSTVTKQKWLSTAKLDLYPHLTVKKRVSFHT
jgi:hypothetical protein